MTEKKAEDSAENEWDGRKVEAPNKKQDTLHVTDRPDILHVADRPDILHVTDRPDILHVTDRPDVLESEKVSDLKKMMKTRGDPNDLQAERGGLKVKDSDFKTE